MKKKIFIACDTSKTNQIRKIIKYTKTNKLNIGYKFGLEFFLTPEGRSFVSRLKNKEIFLDLKLNDIPNTCASAIHSLKDLKNISYLTVHINGGYEIRNIMRPSDPNNEADYSYVYFSLAANYNLNDDEIYIYGSFNNYSLNQSNRMYYNPSLEIYEGVLILKQGFYNYKYVLKQGDLLYKNALSGSHALTENEYLVLVYYRNIGTQNDSLIGVGRSNSFEIRN